MTAVLGCCEIGNNRGLNATRARGSAIFCSPVAGDNFSVAAKSSRSAERLLGGPKDERRATTTDKVREEDRRTTGRAFEYAHNIGSRERFDGQCCASSWHAESCTLNPPVVD
jgi:hypothetical protein